MTIGKSPPGDPRRPGTTPHHTPDTDPVDPAPPTSAAPAPAPIGRVLAEARRAAGLTIDQVSAETRVRGPIIQGIEADDFTRCGGDFYARGHIRSIARAVGVDPEPLIARYDAAHGGSPAAARPVPVTFESERIRPDRRRPNWAAAMVAAIVVVVAVIGFNLVDGKGKQPDAVASTTSPSPTAVVSNAKPSPTPAAPTPSAIAAVPADKVTVKVAVSGPLTWMAVTGSNGSSLFQGDLSDGQSKTFTDDKQIKMVVGNAGSVHLYVNGKDMGLAGAAGQVARLTYTPGDPQAG